MTLVAWVSGLLIGFGVGLGIGFGTNFRILNSQSKVIARQRSIINKQEILLNKSHGQLVDSCSGLQRLDDP